MHSCKVFTVVMLLVSLSVAESSCSTGYEFTKIPPSGVFCDPFDSASQLSVVCEVKTLFDTNLIDISWYFNNSIIEHELANSSKHLIVKHPIGSTTLKSVLTLQNLNMTVDIGAYTCKVKVGESQKLLPEPSYNLKNEIFPPFRCLSTSEFKSEGNCAHVIPIPSMDVSSTSPSPSVSRMSPPAVSLPFISSEFDSTILSASFVKPTTILPTTVILPQPSRISTITVSSQTSVHIGNVSTVLLHPSQLSSHDTISLATEYFAQSTESSHSTYGSMELTNDSNEHMNQLVIWLSIITVLTCVTVVFIIITIIVTVVMHQRRPSNCSSSSVDHVIRRRKPSDPLPPIRNSLILESPGMASVNYASDTTIHCTAPLQSISTGFNATAHHHGIVVYAEIEPHFINESDRVLSADSDNSLSSSLTISCNQVNDISVTDTTSSHLYTLPPLDANETTGSASSWTGPYNWSPLLIQQDKRGSSICSQELLILNHPTCDDGDNNGSITSDSIDIHLSGDESFDKDDDPSITYNGYDNCLVLQQRYAKQTCSLSDQPFLLFGDQCFNRSQSLPKIHCSTACHPDRGTLDSFPFMLGAHDPETPIFPGEEVSQSHDNTRSSSSSSSGCTDLSKYSGDYERHPDYMKMICNRLSAIPPSIVNERRGGVDSGLDGYSDPSCYLRPKEVTASGYKSLNSLTKDISGDYSKLFQAFQERNLQDDFMYISV